MELRQLRYFLAVAKHLNFTRAAAEVHIAQPPLSRQIANLEAELGVPLLERSQRGLKLTRAGVFLEERATEILQRVERTKRDAAAFASKPKQPFRIGFDSALLYGRTPRIFRYLRRKFTEFDFQYAELSSADQARALRNGQVELALGRTAVVDDQIDHVLIRQDPLIVALEADHPAYRGPDQGIRLEDLKAETFILYGDRAGAASRDPVLRFFDQKRFKPADTLRISDLSGALGLVAAGLGVSIVPGTAVLMRGQDVFYAPVAEEGAICPVVLSSLKGHHTDIVSSILTETQRLRQIDGDERDEAGETRRLELFAADPSKDGI